MLQAARRAAVCAIVRPTLASYYCFKTPPRSRSNSVWVKRRTDSPAGDEAPRLVAGFHALMKRCAKPAVTFCGTKCFLLFFPCVNVVLVFTLTQFVAFTPSAPKGKVPNNVKFTTTQAAPTYRKASFSKLFLKICALFWNGCVINPLLMSKRAPKTLLGLWEPLPQTVSVAPEMEVVLNEHLGSKRRRIGFSGKL